MDDLSVLLALFETFTDRLNKAAPSKRIAAIRRGIGSLKACIKLVEPTQKELKQDLLTNKTAMRIRTLWNDCRKLIDLNVIAKEAGLTLKRPSLDHVVLAYYHPKNRLEDLLKRLEAIAASDPARVEIQLFQEWRGHLRALPNQEAVAKAVEALVTERGEKVAKGFAAYLNAKDISGKRKLPKNAPLPKLVEAVACHLWNERIVSKAQEGAR